MNRQTPSAESLRESQYIVAHIDALEQSESFQWFKGLIADRIKDLERSILDADEIPAETRENLRQQRKGMLEILERTRLDREAQVSYLAQYGVTPGDIV